MKARIPTCSDKLELLKLSIANDSLTTISVNYDNESAPAALVNA